MVEMQFGINVLSFFRKAAIVSDVFKVMGVHSRPAATEKASFLRRNHHVKYLNFVFKHINIVSIYTVSKEFVSIIIILYHKNFLIYHVLLLMLFAYEGNKHFIFYKTFQYGSFDVTLCDVIVYFLCYAM